MQYLLHRYLYEGNANKAIAQYQVALKKSPTDHSTITKLYEALVQSDQADAADKLIKDRLSSGQISAKTVNYAAQSAMVRGRYDQAVFYYQALDKADPDNPVVLNNLSWSLFKQGDSSGLELAKRAHEIAPQSVQIMDTYGVLLVDAERYEEGYERGLHDHDATLILDKLLALHSTADLLRFARPTMNR